ncbi:MAG: YabP/YqfC family sporulation protein [Clostridia bacterium]|nr:YabP/YqfC family sporulation protein [Clostridia bacterium]
MQETKHSVIIEQRKLISVSGVESVNSFSEVRIVLTRVGGEKMSVVGTDLKITSFSKVSGAFTAEGLITGVQYGGKGLAARIFK